MVLTERHLAANGDEDGGDMVIASDRGGVMSALAAWLLVSLAAAEMRSI